MSGHATVVNDDTQSGDGSAERLDHPQQERCPPTRLAYYDFGRPFRYQPVVNAIHGESPPFHTDALIPRQTIFHGRAGPFQNPHGSLCGCFVHFPPYFVRTRPVDGGRNPTQSPMLSIHIDLGLPLGRPDGIPPPNVTPCKLFSLYDVAKE